jgi:hypothetical protein
VELYLHSPKTPSWRGAQLKKKSVGTTLPLPSVVKKVTMQIVAHVGEKKHAILHLGNLAERRHCISLNEDCHVSFTIIWKGEKVFRLRVSTYFGSVIVNISEFLKLDHYRYQSSDGWFGRPSFKLWIERFLRYKESVESEHFYIKRRYTVG